MRTCWLLTCLVWISAAPLHADGPADNIPEKVRPIPPQGIALSEADRAELQAGVAKLGEAIAALPAVLIDQPRLTELLPDVVIYYNAVRYALEYNELFAPGEVATARKLLEQGLERAAQLRAGQAPWNSATGLVVRGYVSQLDGSVQPYGLVVPDTYQSHTPSRFRLDVWCHGRGETLSEVNFIAGRQSSAGEFTPPGAFVLHPYGRYCNANKFAGEVDLFEALAHIQAHYPIDTDRLVVRGFSMGGAACWQFAVHYPTVWAAAAPGAGFSETPEFLRTFQGETLKPTEYEKQLWHWYDCTDYALNLYNCPTVAYSGEVDIQKQAADIMQQALAAEQIDLVHVVGAKAGHNYTPEAKTEINRRIDQLAAQGREIAPPAVHFTTWTLKYNRSAWVAIDSLEQHWQRARIDAQLTAGSGGGPSIKTQNIAALTLELPAGRAPWDLRKPVLVELDGATLTAPQPKSDRSWSAHFRKQGKKWQVVASDKAEGLAKRHDLQGPIDDALMGSFMMVRPTGPALNPAVAKWTEAELAHALTHWRRQFRGDARVANDTEVTDHDIASHHLILWGDPSSNAVLKKIADKLPLRWTADQLQLGTATLSGGQHVPVLVYPNPLNPERYVVLNSSFTFREYDYLNNARQVPKLPDFAVLDVSVPATSQAPGRVVTAGFFDESWQLPAKLPPATGGR